MQVSIFYIIAKYIEKLYKKLYEKSTANDRKPKDIRGGEVVTGLFTFLISDLAFKTGLVSFIGITVVVSAVDTSCSRRKSRRVCESCPRCTRKKIIELCEKIVRH